MITRFSRFFLAAVLVCNLHCASDVQRAGEQPVQEEDLEQFRAMVRQNRFQEASAILSQKPRTGPRWAFERGWLYQEMGAFYYSLFRFGLHVEYRGYDRMGFSSSTVPSFFLGICSYELGKFSEAVRIFSGLNRDRLPTEFQTCVDLFLQMSRLALGEKQGTPVSSNADALVRLRDWMLLDRGLEFDRIASEYDESSDAVLVDDHSLVSRLAGVALAGIQAELGNNKRARELLDRYDAITPLHREMFRLKLESGEVKNLPIEYYTAFPWRIFARTYFQAAEEAFGEAISGRELGYETVMGRYLRGELRLSLGKFKQAEQDFSGFLDVIAAGSGWEEDADMVLIRPLADAGRARGLYHLQRQDEAEAIWRKYAGTELADLAVRADRAVLLAVLTPDAEEAETALDTVLKDLTSKSYRHLSYLDQEYYRRTVGKLSVAVYSFPEDSLLGRQMLPLQIKLYKSSTNSDPSPNSLPFLFDMAYCYFVSGKLTDAQRVLAGMQLSGKGERERFYPIMTLYQQANQLISASRVGDGILGPGQ
jgi:tetratricopeptide (TPR) repeat protein